MKIAFCGFFLSRTLTAIFLSCFGTSYASLPQGANSRFCYNAGTLYVAGPDLYVLRQCEVDGSISFKSSKTLRAGVEVGVVLDLESYREGAVFSDVGRGDICFVDREGNTRSLVKEDERNKVHYPGSVAVRGDDVFFVNNAGKDIALLREGKVSGVTSDPRDVFWQTSMRIVDDQIVFSGLNGIKTIPLDSKDGKRATRWADAPAGKYTAGGRPRFFRDVLKTKEFVIALTEDSVVVKRVATGETKSFDLLCDEDPDDPFVFGSLAMIFDFVVYMCDHQNICFMALATGDVECNDIDACDPNCEVSRQLERHESPRVQ